MSEAASMEGNLSDDENIQLLDSGDGHINIIQLDDGSCGAIAFEARDKDSNDQDSIPLPQRLTRRTASAASARGSPVGTVKKLTTTTPISGGGKRPLPFNSPSKQPAQAKKTLRGSSSKPPSSGEESEEGMQMASPTPPTQKKKLPPTDTCTSATCIETRNMVDSILQRLAKLEGSHSFMSETFDRYSASEMEQLSLLTDRVVSIDSTISKQSLDMDQLKSALMENQEKINVASHDIVKTQQTLLDIAAKQDKIAAEWAAMKGKMQEGQISGGQGPLSEDTAFFLGGIHTLRDFYNNYYGDPAQIVRDLLVDLHLYCSMDRTFIADGQARSSGDRTAARAMVIIMRSAQHKKEAIIRIKRYLNQHGIRSVTVSDIFPADQVNAAKILSRYAQNEKNCKRIVKYRVINKNGKAALQIQKKHSEQFKDDSPSAESLANYAHPLPNRGGRALADEVMETDQPARELHRSREAPQPAKRATTTGRPAEERANLAPPGRTTMSHQPAVPQPGGGAAQQAAPAHTTHRPAVPQPEKEMDHRTDYRKQLEQAQREVEFYKKMASSARQGHFTSDGAPSKNGAPPPPFPQRSEDGPDGIRPLRNN